MKKIVLIFVLGVFTFGSSGFKSDNLPDIQQVDCQEYAAAAWLEAKSMGLFGDRLTQVWSNAHWACEENFNW